MAPPDQSSTHLSDSDIRQIAADIAGGRPQKVWFTAAVVGMTAGRSGQVIAVGDPNEIDFLRVRPTGSMDTLSFSPAELTLNKPVRRSKRTTTTKLKAHKSDPATQNTLW